MTLGKAYDEIMDKIEVTPEMRRRVLARVQAEDIVPVKPKVVRFPAWKKYSRRPHPWKICPGWWALM